MRNGAGYSLKTRPVSSSSPPVEAPEILPSRMEETSEAATMSEREREPSVAMEKSVTGSKGERVGEGGIVSVSIWAVGVE